MAEFVKSNAVAYAGGVVDKSNLNVGYLEKKNRVVCLPFSVGKTGASEFSFLLENAYLNYTSGADGHIGKFAFVVAPQNVTGYEDYNGAVTGNIGDGLLEFESIGSGLYNVRGSVKKVLLEGEYYLWLFPNYVSEGQPWFSFRIGSACVATYELSGAAGLIRIQEGDKELLTIPMVKIGGVLVQHSATIKSGDSLIYCV